MRSGVVIDDAAGGMKEHYRKAGNDAGVVKPVQR